MTRDDGSAPSFPAPDHDHRHCVAGALDEAEAICARQGARLTKLRRQVLEIVWSGHAPIGAYDILDRLAARGRRAAPIAIYRALGFLMEQGLVHRLASQNAYVGCGSPGAPHVGQFLICSDCGTVAELSDRRIDRAIASGAARTGFAVEAPMVEIQGLCPDCRTDGGTDGHPTNR